MTQLSGKILLAAAVVTSPAWWSTLVEQAMPLEVTITRFLIAVAIAWFAFSLAEEFLWPSAAPRVPVEARQQVPGEGPEPD
jgi:hypothetical protein